MSVLNQEDIRHPFKTPARNVKLLKSRAFNDENNARFYPGTVKKSRTKPITQRNFLVGKSGSHWSVRRPNEYKGVISVNPLSEITNKTPYPKRTKENTLSATLDLLDTSTRSSEITPSCRRLSSTRKTGRLLNSAYKNLKTPISGNPWDVSDGSIEVIPPAVEPTPLEDDDDVEYCPPTPFVNDHGLDLEFPDYTLAHHLLSGTIADGILEPIHKMELTFETYQLEPLPLIEESDLLLREFEMDKSSNLAEDGKPSVTVSTQTRTKIKAAARHSRIPSLSKRYVSPSIAKKDSSDVQHARTLTVPLRSKPKVTQSTTTSALVHKAVASNDIVAELLIDPFEAEDIYFDV